MFVPLTEKERQTLFRQNDGCYIPGYTGHCPTLRFQYGTSYGSRTKEILQDLRDKNVIKSIQRSPYRQNNEHDRAALQPIPRKHGQMSDPGLAYRNKSSKYIIGYTGFIPTINFRYGKSFGKAADDSMYDFSTKQRVLREEKLELDKLRSQSAPKITSIRNADDVKYTIRRKHDSMNDFKERHVSPEFPPITGYTGYVPKVKGNEESLSQRYNNVVKRSLTLLQEERQNYLMDLQRRKSYILNSESGVFDESFNYKEP